MQAVMLAAGMGKRLGKGINKCMVEVAGKPLIAHCIKALENANISKFIVVTGYNCEELEKNILKYRDKMEVYFVRNVDYSTTNNIWSLYLSKDELKKDDTILIESDLIFDSNLIKELLECDSQDVAVVAKLEKWMDGTTVLLKGNEITSIVSKKEFKQEDFDVSYKTVNIYKFSKDFLNKEYIPTLEKYIQDNGKNEYYEMALKNIVASKKVCLGALNARSKWYEIDTPEDLTNAEKIFANV